MPVQVIHEIHFKKQTIKKAQININNMPIVSTLLLVVKVPHEFKIHGLNCQAWF